METVRDIVIIISGITGTFALIVLVFMVLKLYPRASQALDRVGQAAEDIHGAVEGAKSGARLASGVFDVVSPVLPGPSWLKLTYRGAASIPRAVRFISRFRRSKSSTC